MADTKFDTDDALAVKRRGTPRPRASNTYLNFGTSRVINGDTWFSYSNASGNSPWDLQIQQNTPLIRCEGRWGYTGLSTDDVAYTNRAQFRSVQSMALDTSYWVSCAIYWQGTTPNSLTAVECNEGAFFALIATRHVEDAQDLAGQGGPWSLGLIGEKPLIKTRYTTQDPMVDPPTATDRHLGDALPRNTWIYYVWNLKFDPDGAGVLKQWRNGVQELNLTNIAMGYPDEFGPRLRAGIYRGHVGVRPSDTQVIFFDNLEWGTTDLTSRITNPLPVHTL